MDTYHTAKSKQDFPCFVVSARIPPKCQKRGRGGRGVWGEFRRARAFRRSEAEAVNQDFPQSEF